MPGPAVDEAHVLVPWTVHGAGKGGAMAGKFLQRSAIIDAIKRRECINAQQKRLGLTRHPARFTTCGCSDAGCSGFYTVDRSTTLPTAEACAAALRADNRRRKERKRSRASGDGPAR
jgi:hypothetical protein